MTTYESPAASQVAVYAPNSSTAYYHGAIGHVTALNWGFTFPGGADQATWTLEVPAAYRNQQFNPGWTARIYRGGCQMWSGKLDEPVPTKSGWNFTAVGTGQLGTNFMDYYTSTWPSSEPDQVVNNAIGRGLPWQNPGIGTPSGIWLGQATDPASQTVAQLLALCCTRGGLGWYVNSQPGGPVGDVLTLAPLPAVVDRLLVCNTPVARTLGGDINTIWIKYQISAPSGNTPAQYGVTSVQNAASVSVHGVMETYVDLSSAGVMSAGAAQAVGNSVLSIYQRASFAGPFTVNQGQVLNLGGQAVDLGSEQAGHVYRPILTDYGFGGEINTLVPMTFIGGGYKWDQTSQTAQIIPYQTLDQSISGLLSSDTTTGLNPISVA